MIDVSISYGFTEDNKYKLEEIPTKIQLAIYKYKLYEENKKYILEKLEGKINVRVVHLPLDTMKTDSKLIFKMMDEIYARTGCEKYIIHPNKGIQEFVDDFIRSGMPVMLCVETFNWRRHKVYRSPLDIIEAIVTLPNVWMTLDTTHIEDIWFDHRIMGFLLKYTKVIHLSNRANGIGEHLPFNHPNGVLPLVRFVRDLKYQYKWGGDIVLEYKTAYHDKLIKNLHYVESLLK